MRKFLLFLIQLLPLVCYSQVPVGFLFDAHGNSVNVNYDVFTYKPSNAVVIQQTSGSYKQGKYYGSDGKVEAKLIKAYDTEIYCKNGEDDSDSHRIKAIINTSVKVEADSFLVINNYYRNNGLKTKPIFVKHLYENESVEFARYYFHPHEEYKFLAKRRDSRYWKEISIDKDEFNSKVGEYFSLFPKLKDKIEGGEYTKKDIPNLIKMLEYHALAKSKDPIVFDKYWNQSSVNDSVVYYGLVEQVEDFKWKIDYYKNDTLFFKGNYSSLVPLKKDLEFVSYYPDGRPKIIQAYEEGDLKTTTLFYPNGRRFLSFSYYDKVSFEEGYNGDMMTVKTKHCKYDYVNDENGQNLLSAKDTNTITIQDIVSGYTFYQTYIENELVASYRIENGKKVYSVVNPAFIVNLGAVRKKIDKYRSNAKFKSAVYDNAHGNVLVHVQVDNKGVVRTYKVLNSLHAEYDKFLNDFLLEVFAEEKPKIKLNAFKVEKEKVDCEFVMPVTFMLNSFQYQSNYYHWYDYNMFQHFQYQMRECHYQNIIPTFPTIPMTPNPPVFYPSPHVIY